ncbi:MAG: type II toxin-antitoxin system HicA family toxin [Candidatus Korarchaeota archaeon]|nr:type II toxin-antitoxin system HicA family toxin [Candidatus Korarchaeota archaeon]
MKLPRDLDGEELAKLLKKFGYRLVRRTGSHMRLKRRVRYLRRNYLLQRP